MGGWLLTMTNDGQMLTVAERDRVRARLPGWLEADIAFAPEAEFGPLGPGSASVGHGASANPGAADAHYKS